MMVNFYNPGRTIYDLQRKTRDKRQQLDQWRMDWQRRGSSMEPPPGPPAPKEVPGGIAYVDEPKPLPSAPRYRGAARLPDLDVNAAQALARLTSPLPSPGRDYPGQASWNSPYEKAMTMRQIAAANWAKYGPGGGWQDYASGGAAASAASDAANRARLAERGMIGEQQMALEQERNRGAKERAELVPPPGSRRGGTGPDSAVYKAYRESADRVLQLRAQLFAAEVAKIEARGEEITPDKEAQIMAVIEERNPLPVDPTQVAEPEVPDLSDSLSVIGPIMAEQIKAGKITRREAVTALAESGMDQTVANKFVYGLEGQQGQAGQAAPPVPPGERENVPPPPPPPSPERIEEIGKVRVKGPVEKFGSSVVSGVAGLGKTVAERAGGAWKESTQKDPLRVKTVDDFMTMYSDKLATMAPGGRTGNPEFAAISQQMTDLYRQYKQGWTTRPKDFQEGVIELADTALASPSIRANPALVEFLRGMKATASDPETFAFERPVSVGFGLVKPPPF
ncbi:MAG: hypothetical protein KKD77_20670 [Gammaproteobacteria bacterium]|nr:hypothetical protein [Gammaproteobacteria bacterium]